MRAKPRPLKSILHDIARCKENLHRTNNEALSAAEMAGDSAAVCRCRCNRGYVQKTLRLLAHEAERARAMDLTI